MIDERSEEASGIQPVVPPESTTEPPVAEGIAESATPDDDEGRPEEPTTSDLASASTTEVERVALVWDDRLWRLALGARDTLRLKRLLRFHRLLGSSGGLSWRETQVVPPDSLSLSVLEDFHSASYVQGVQALAEARALQVRRGAHGFGVRLTPASAHLWALHTLHVRAALTAARLVAEGAVRRAFTPAGGFHHADVAAARAGHVFNDLVLVIRQLLSAGLRVAYLDVDATHGGPVQSAFYDTDRVLTISLHEGPQFHFPGTGWWQEIGEGAGKGYTVNVGLPPATGDEPYLWAFEEVVVPLLERFGADVLVTTTGLDAHYDDPLAHLRLSTHGFARLWRRLRSLVPRWVAVGGAGQNLDIAARAWAILYAVLAAREGALPQRLPRRYVDAWGPGMLHDDELAPLSKELDEYVWTTVRAQVRALQRLVFPLHGLHAPPLAPGAELELLERPAPAPAPLTASIPFARRPSTRGATPLRRARPAQREHEYPTVEDEVPTTPVDRDEVVPAGQPGSAPAAPAPRDETQGDAEARRGRRRGRRGRRPADSEPANRREPGSRLAEDQTTQRRGSGNRSRPRGASERRPAPPAPSGEKGPAADGESRPGRRRRRGGRRGRNPVEG